MRREEQIALWAGNIGSNLESDRYARGRDLAELLDQPRPARAATVIGAGPSLRRNAHEVSGSTVRLCAAAALGYCVERGVEVDWVVSLDPRPEESVFFEGVATEGLRLITPVTVAPETLAAWRGEVWFCRQAPAGTIILRDEVEGLDEAAEQLAEHTGVRGWYWPLHNVVPTAMGLAVGYFNAQVILVIGADLSWTYDYYASGRDTAGLKPELDDLRVKDINGDERYTHRGFCAVRAVLDDLTGEVERCGGRVHNCTGAGIWPHRLLDLSAAYELYGLGVEPGWQARV